MNVVFTSAYCPILGRAVPLVASILIGASYDLYYQHYAALLKSLPFSTWGEFKDGFPGFLGGFSDAERVGLETALRTHFDTSHDGPIHLEEHYLCDNADFVRSLISVSKDGEVIPPSREMNFYFRAKALLNSQHTEATFRKAVTEILEEYPKTRNWLKWHLAPSRGRHFFSALTSIDWEFSENTDLQENLGYDFQMLVGNQKATVEETLGCISRHINQVQGDYVLASNGISVLVDQPKLKRPYNNIGRAPNTTDTPSTRSVHEDHAKKPKLTEGTKQDSSTLGSDHKDNGDTNNDKNSWQSFGMPWGFSHEDLQVTNTCALDTTLMAWYFLRIFHRAALPLEVLAGANGSRVTDILCQVMEKIQAREWNKARWIWCKEILHLGTSGQNLQSLWSSLSEAFLENIPGLSMIQVTRSTVCSSKACPRSFKRDTQAMDSIMVQNARQINQENFDASLSFAATLCSEKIDAKDARMIDEADIRKVAFRDVDNGEDNEWFVCNGRRTEKSSQISKLPYLLVLNCLDDWHSSSKDGSVDIQTPQSTLVINGTSYTLAAIFYGLPESHQGKGYQFDQVCTAKMTK
ncbi:hypothetical protein BGW38_003027 [Lunasporangiospora selenospora]|uniref:Uncharacterized protein n=1 Tax=Lunasporangiospora selenospora TaxID=979761 RepID=A0A9P6KHP7_9FUNG|nr:hypothetical protein BGW38_003027 [Lunasporangiospora selenospora]